MFLVHCSDNNNLKKKIKNAVDINKFKCGKYLPISKIKIIHKNEFMKKVNSKEDLLLISNPNYKREIMKELKENSLNRIKTLCL
jgi:hypothetical protein